MSCVSLFSVAIIIIMVIIVFDTSRRMETTYKRGVEQYQNCSWVVSMTESLGENKHGIST